MAPPASRWLQVFYFNNLHVVYSSELIFKESIEAFLALILFNKSYVITKKSKVEKLSTLYISLIFQKILLKIEISVYMCMHVPYLPFENHYLHIPLAYPAFAATPLKLNTSKRQTFDAC